MSSKITSVKKGSDSKATVSFNSDSDDDDSSSSSRLSSSATSEEDSEVETVTFTLPLPPSSQASGKDGTGKDAVSQSKTKTKEATKAASQDSKKSAFVDELKDGMLNFDSKSRMSPKKPEIAEGSESKSVEVDTRSKKSPAKPEDELKVTKAKVAVRSNSPKITISNVDDVDDVTTTKKTSKKEKSNSPRKTPESEEVGKRGVAPKTEEEAEIARPVKKISKLVATGEREKSPKSPSPEVDSAPTDLVRLKKTSQDKDAERAKSPKKTSNERTKSSKTSHEENEVETTSNTKKIPVELKPQGAKSPRKTSAEKEQVEAAQKSSKESSKTSSTELLRSGASPEKSPARILKSKVEPELAAGAADDGEETGKAKKTKKTTKSPKKLNNEPSEELLPGKGDEELKPKPTKDKNERKHAESNDLLLTKDASKKNEAALSKERVLVDEADKTDALDRLIYGGIKPDNSTNAEAIKVEIIDDLGSTGKPRNSLDTKVSASEVTSSDVAVSRKETPQGKTAAEELNSTEVETRFFRNKDADHGKPGAVDAVQETKASKKDGDGGPGNRLELENEESEFTYRRKSMDEFIKRILAEAKEERLKQKQGTRGDGGVDEQVAPLADGYGEYNGELPKEGAARQRWSSSGGGGGGTKEKEASNLDRRLASIEKRRFGGSDAGSEPSTGAGSKFNRDQEEEDGGAKIRTKPPKNDVKGDFDLNLDEDLEEINRFLQSRKAATSRFDFDESEQNGDLEAGTPNAKRRWLAGTGKEQQQQQQQLNDDDSIPSPSPGSKIQALKKYNAELDFNDDDERFLARFKRERDPTLPEDSFAPRRREQTDEIVREKTRNVRVLVDQQVDIVQAMRTTSKNLDELEKEIREVRQVCLDRQARIEALEGALSAEYRAFENDQLAASDRQKSVEGVASMKEDFGLTLGRLRRQDKVKSESLDEENFPFRRRSGSVASTTSFSSSFTPARAADVASDLTDFRPPSGLRQQKARTESESDYPLGFDRRRGGSMNRDRGVGDIGDPSLFGPDDPGMLLYQRPARSRASIATSTPAVDLDASGDSFLAKIRAKYSFLAPSFGAANTPSYTASVRSQGLGSSSLLSSDSKYGRRYGLLEDPKLRSRDFLTSASSPYGSLATGSSYISNRFSFAESRTPSLNLGGYGGISTGAGDSTRMRRAQSVSDASLDRPTTSPTHLGSSGGGEFHSRFLDKVRGKKAMGEEAPPPKSQEKPFRSRFLKTTSFDASGSRSDRMTNGLENDSAGRAEVDGNA